MRDGVFARAMAVLMPANAAGGGCGIFVWRRTIENPTVGMMSMRVMRPTICTFQSALIVQCQRVHSYAMCIPEVLRVTHPNHAKDDADDTQQAKGNKEPETPFSVLLLADGMACEDGESPNDT